MADDSILSPILRMVDKLPLWVQAARRVLPSSPQPALPPSVVNGVQGDLEALQRMLRRIQAVLTDAERREIREESVKLWLSELKDVAYDADDVLGEYEYELLRAQVEEDQARDRKGTHTPRKRKHQEDLSPLTLDASFWGTIAGMVGKIRCRFEEISEQRNALRLKQEDGERRCQETLMDRPPTSYIVDASTIYGRQDDLQEVVDQLLSSDGSKKGNLLVLPIVGMGGIGKTTLAQLVYNEPKVCSRFPVRGWVCVSEDFEVDKLTRRIIETLSKKACFLQELSVLQEELISWVQGKRFLLILDDLWNEKPRLWESLQMPLRSGAEGSVIIVTTRNEGVARIMQTTPLRRLGCLSDDDCWTIFWQNAFHSEDSSEHQDLQGIGRKIADKCKGLPLAARVLGSLLQDVYDVEKWEDVLQNDLWDIGDGRGDEIIPALRLSYLHLPSHIRQCFVYSAAFPKDFRFRRDKLVMLWMAQGILQRGRTEEAEDTGIRCFDELVKRSFFQYDPENSNFFVMHDLIHDLAQYISGGEYYQIEKEKQECSLVERVRHMSLCDPRNEDGEVMTRFLSHPRTKAMRTLLVMRAHEISWTDVSAKLRFHGGLVPHVEFLRALSLSGVKIGELPDSIGNLKHLRYLNLEFTDISILPESVFRLYHLQTLLLEGCVHLESLSKDVGKLSNLRCLTVRKDHTGGVDVVRMPSDIGRLTSLRTLDVLNVGGREEDCGVQALEGLTHLRGRLEILNLQNVLKADHARLADLKGKRKLKELLLCWSGDPVCSSGPASPDVQTKVLENLRPPNHLIILEVYEYGGLAFPSWMGDDPSPFSKLTHVVIGWCPNMSALPPLGLLPSLRHLRIHGFDAMEALGAEFRGFGARVAFPALVELELHHMEGCRAWQGVERGDFPLLKRLSIVSFPKLESIVPLYILPALEVLDLFKCGRLASLKFQGGGPHSSSPSGPPPLREIHISMCPLLCFSGEDDQQLPSTLRDLRISSDCPLLVDWCRTEAGRNLAHVPGARFWRDRGGRCFVSTTKPEVRNGELQVDFIPILDDPSGDNGSAPGHVVEDKGNMEL